MSLKISTTMVGDVAVCRLEGRVTLGEGASYLRETCRGLLQKGVTKLVLNYSACFYSDSSGLAELVAAYTAFRNRGGNLVLAELTEKINALMHITKCDKILKIFPDSDTAIAFFTDSSTQIPNEKL